MSSVRFSGCACCQAHRGNLFVSQARLAHTGSRFPHRLGHACHLDDSFRAVTPDRSHLTWVVAGLLCLQARRSSNVKEQRVVSGPGASLFCGVEQNIGEHIFVVYG